MRLIEPRDHNHAFDQPARCRRAVATSAVPEPHVVIGEADRFGLISGNGGGKSTLLKCLAGAMEPTTGEITRSRGMRVGYVEQDMPDNLLDLSLAEAIRRALPPADARVTNGVSLSCSTNLAHRRSCMSVRCMR